MGPGLRRDDVECGAYAPDKLPRIQFSNSQITSSVETVIASEAKQSIKPRKEGRMDRFARNDGTLIPDTRSRPRHAMRPSRAFISRPLGGRGECRVPAAPAASCALCIGRTHTSNNEYTGITRHSR